jgi:hypothetical protein
MTTWQGDAPVHTAALRWAPDLFATAKSMSSTFRLLAFPGNNRQFCSRP